MSYSKAEHPLECPDCGFLTPIEVREIVESRADMIEVTDEYIEAQEVARLLKAKRNAAWAIGLTGTRDELTAAAIEAGYKLGWVNYRLAEQAAVVGKGAAL